jgi:hypothetical protein
VLLLFFFEKTAQIERHTREVYRKVLGRRNFAVTKTGN